MNWFRENRWLGRFLIVFAICMLLAIIFLYLTMSSWNDAKREFDVVAMERNRLEHLDPFPIEANYRKMKMHFENYGADVNKFKDELKTQTLAVEPLAPNEFQSRLRQAIIATADKARANRVKLPDNFQLGFDELTTALPNTAVAPLLGQQLSQVELLMNILIDARVDAVTALRRAPLPPETAAATTPAVTRKPAEQTKVIERNIVEVTFVAAPSAARKALNQIASSDRQFFIIRTLHVRNEQEKGPPREQTGSSAAGTAATTAAPTGAIKFIVGNEHIQAAARIEMVRFTF